MLFTFVNYIIIIKRNFIRIILKSPTCLSTHKIGPIPSSTKNILTKESVKYPIKTTCSIMSMKKHKKEMSSRVLMRLTSTASSIG